MAGSKKFPKGKPCAYCGAEATAPVTLSVAGFSYLKIATVCHRFQSCDACNRKKSALETEMMALLPFGKATPSTGTD